MNPCPKCQSLGKCSGTCWLLDIWSISQRIDEEMKTPEYALVLATCVPYREPIGYGKSSSWRWKALGEML